MQPTYKTYAALMRALAGSLVVLRLAGAHWRHRPASPVPRRATHAVDEELCIPLHTNRPPLLAPPTYAFSWAFFVVGCWDPAASAGGNSASGVGEHVCVWADTRADRQPASQPASQPHARARTHLCVLVRRQET